MFFDPFVEVGIVGAIEYSNALPLNVFMKLRLPS
jgi:hypothetical protein